jgi:hypothetical protein
VHEVRRAARVQLHVVVGRLDPVDRIDVQEGDVAPRS